MAATRWWRGFIRNNTRKSYPFLLGLMVGAGLTEFLENVYEEAKTRFLNIDESLLPSTKLFEKKYGLPTNSEKLHYTYHTLKYDNVKKVPLWVAEHMTKDQLHGPADRQSCSFKSDTKILEKFRSCNDDYLGSGFSRGHMAPAANIKSSQNGMSDTFYLSNIVPQDYHNNGGFWYRMELYCRALAKKYDNVYVVSGPLYLPEEMNGGKYVRFQVIGENNVAVPSHLYKVILVETHDKPKAIGSFIVPNSQKADQFSLRDFQVPLEDVEKSTGCELFPKLNRQRVKDLCVVDSCKLIKTELVELYNMSRWLKKAKSDKQLDHIWKNIQEKNIKVDQEFMDEYLRKKNEFKLEHKT